ncbi:hypothetical protein [Amycolatopsis sp. NPDC051102]|uniref:vWA-MoxR associated conflict system protein n=1 Tax=Amycolatopsis sp. NPDC051102 TaxID=3155163 RepID=UPI00341A5784
MAAQNHAAGHLSVLERVAGDLRELLADAEIGGCIPVETMPTTKAEIECAVSAAIRTAGERHAVLVLAFLGHGFTTDQDSHLYYMAGDTRIASPASGVDVSRLIAEAAGEPGVAGVIAVVDTCHASGGLPDVHRITGGPGGGRTRVAVLFASTADQPAFRMQFTTALNTVLRDGLSGAGPHLLPNRALIQRLRTMTAGQVVGHLDYDADPYSIDELWLARNTSHREAASYGSAHYRLDPPVLVSKSRPVRGPGDLLDVNRAVVPYRERAFDKKLTSWRDGPEIRISALLLHGEGGQGKTRAARHCAESATESGWEVLHAIRYDGSRLPSLSNDSSQPLLVLVDYVERWEPAAIEQLAADLEATGRNRVRLLLISRNATGMWRPVEATIDPFVDRIEDPIELSELANGFIDGRLAFAEAVTAFQIAMGIPEKQLVQSDDEFAARSPIELHMIALAAVCADHEGTATPRASRVSAFLLQRERRYWLKIIGTHRNIANSASTFDRLERVAVIATLIGPVDNRSDALEVLRDHNIAGSDASADEILDLHTLLYPPRLPGHLLTPMHPDRLGEDFLAECLSRPSYLDMLESLPKQNVPSSTDGKLRMFATISAVAERNPTLKNVLRQQVFDRPAAYVHTNSKGVRYYLHSAEVTLRGGIPQTIYFFAKDIRQANVKGAPSSLPPDRVVKENDRNGFLTISKRKT